MANKHIKRYLSSFATRKIQIKIRYSAISEWLKLKRPTIPKVDKDVEELRLSESWWEHKMVEPL